MFMDRNSLLVRVFFVGMPWVLWGCREEAAAPVMGPPVVSVSVPLQRDVPVVVELIGQTEATANVEIRPRIDGTVERIEFAEGSEVKAGDLLFVLDRKPLEEKLAAARGDVGQLKAALGRARQDVERFAPLAARGAVPQKDLDTAKAVEQQAVAALSSGEARERAAALDLGYAEITAPVPGIIGAKGVDVGSVVARAGNGPAMAVISPFDPIWVNIEISEVAYLNNAEFFRGPDVQSPVFSLILANGKTHSATGRLSFVDRAVNPGTGTLRVRVEFPNPDKIIRPGQFCRVRAQGKAIRGALLLPQRAVQELQGRHNVLVADAAGKIAFRPVKTGLRVGSLWVIESGLQPSETVVIEGMQKVRDGAVAKLEPGAIDESPLREMTAGLPGAEKR
jgi:membrane fusion protein (multidrug efflux system)